MYYTIMGYEDSRAAGKSVRREMPREQMLDYIRRKDGKRGWSATDWSVTARMEDVQDCNGLDEIAFQVTAAEFEMYNGDIY